MAIGLFVEDSRTKRGADDLEAYVNDVRAAKERGFDSVWSPQVGGLDVLTAIAIAGREVPGITFGTAVIPTYSRLPVSLAQHALTTQFAVGGRLTLGIGLSHKVVVEGMWGCRSTSPCATCGST